MNKKIDQYIDDGCGNPPPIVFEWGQKQIPASLRPSGSVNAQRVGIVVGGVAAGYLIYRGVRMLPSLAPPLWWTIPFNAALP